MKKISFIAILLLAVFSYSCNEIGGLSSDIDKSQIVGHWTTDDAMYHEVYYSDGTGKEWDLNDDVNEDEAKQFTWEFDNTSETKFFKYYPMEIGGGIIPQYCNILELTSTTFNYNNEGLRATYYLIRAD